MKDEFDFNKISKANKILLNCGKIMLISLCIVPLLDDFDGWDFGAIMGYVLLLIMSIIVIVMALKDNKNLIAKNNKDFVNVVPKGSSLGKQLITDSIKPAFVNK